MTRTPARRLADVAKKVGVSEATVSRVLNGKAGVSDSTRESVLTALDVLGYERPTQLRGERARLIGLVLPELQNPIFPALAEVIGGALAQRGFTPVLCTRTEGGLSEADYVDMLLDQHASGVVFAGGNCTEIPAPHDHFRMLRTRGVPVVIVNAAIESLEFPRVACDDFAAAGQAFNHLAALGHDRIGLLLGPIRAVRRAGLTVPGDVSVVGYDDSAWLNCTDPPLTTVRQPIESMGKSAVALLVGQMETTVGHAEELLFEPELAVRGSTGPAPVRVCPSAVSRSAPS